MQQLPDALIPTAFNLMNMKRKLVKLMHVYAQLIISRYCRW